MNAQTIGFLIAQPPILAMLFVMVDLPTYFKIILFIHGLVFWEILQGVGTTKDGAQWE